MKWKQWTTVHILHMKQSMATIARVGASGGRSLCSCAGYSAFSEKSWQKPECWHSLALKETSMREWWQDLLPDFHHVVYNTIHQWITRVSHRASVLDYHFLNAASAFFKSENITRCNPLRCHTSERKKKKIEAVLLLFSSRERKHAENTEK